jgi:hypothetical protein
MEPNLFDLLGFREPDPIPQHQPPAPRANRRKKDARPTGPLYSFLRERYFACTVAAGPGHSPPLKIDDRDSTDVYDGFCEISLLVTQPEDGSFVLEMIRPPHDAEVMAVIEEMDGRWTEGKAGTKVQIHLAIKEHRWIRKLAQAIGRVVSPRHVSRTGKRYDIPEWRFVARRTMNALLRLADHLWEYRKLVVAAKRGK